MELLRYDVQARRFDSYLPGLSAGPVDFSPDRKWIAYVSYPDMTLWRSRVDGSDKMQLTFPPVRAYEPRWSPDGSQIVFMDVRFDSSWKIYLLSSSGGSPEVLTQTNTYEADATWTPDGKSIVFGKSDTNSAMPAHLSPGFENQESLLYSGFRWTFLTQTIAGRTLYLRPYNR